MIRFTHKLKKAKSWRREKKTVVQALAVAFNNKEQNDLRFIGEK